MDVRAALSQDNIDKFKVSTQRCAALHPHNRNGSPTVSNRREAAS